MSARTRRTMIAEAFGEEIAYQTAGDYTVAGVVMLPDAEHDFPRKIVAVGNSWESVTRRTRGASRRIRPSISRASEHYVMQVVALTEATAPVVREYFGTHQVNITQAYHPERGWQTTMLHGGRSSIRDLAAHGYTVVTFYHRTRSADFQTEELLKSMNSRKKI